MFLRNPNGAYPVHMGDLQLEFPSWQEGDALPSGWVEIAPGIIPSFDAATEIWVEVEPAEVDGVLTRQFVVRNLTAAEIAAREASNS